MEISLKAYDWFVVCFFLVLSCTLFYQSWVNLVKKELTKFSLDAIVLAYLRIIHGRKYVANAAKLVKKESNRLQKLGFVGLAGGFTALYSAISWHIKYIH